MPDICESLQSQVTFGVLVLVILNMVFFGFLWRSRTVKEDLCDMDDILLAVTKYIQTNGQTSIETALKGSCKVKDVKTEDFLRIQKDLEDSVYECNAKPLKYFPKKLESNILTLFTSWPSNEKDKEGIHHNTLANWSRFQPRINVVIFTNDSQDATYAKERGWTVFSIVHHFAGGAPVLRTMFQTVMENFNSSFYGYANSDILFADNLFETLSAIKSKFGNENPILLTGRRFNVDHMTPKEAASHSNVYSSAKTRGKLFEIHSEDYFITSRTFPWETVPDLVVGRPAYDNWLVAHARCKNSTVVDTTDTLTAVHQTTDQGNKESLKRVDPKFNDNLILQLKLNRNYELGFITCPEWKSYKTICGATDIYHRDPLPKYCECPRTNL